MGCAQSHPFSRGRTHVSSTDPNNPPVMDPRDFFHPADLEIMARHVQALENKLRVSKRLAPILKPDSKRNHPDEIQVRELKGAKKCIIDTAPSECHACGSTAMLPREKGGVVDPKLVV